MTDAISYIEITVKLLGTPKNGLSEYSLKLDSRLKGNQALQKIKHSIKEKGIKYHYQLLVNGKFAHTGMKKDLYFREGDEVKIIPILGGG